MSSLNAGGIWRRLVLRRLSSLAGGRISLQDGFGRFAHGEGELQCAVTVHDHRFYKALVFRGGIGAAEAYERGWWDCDDLVSLGRILVRNIGRESIFERGLASIFCTAQWLSHRLRVNTRAISRRNIKEHYDLGNEFFALFLDQTMTYSSAIYDGPSMTQEEASINKLRRIADKLGVQPEHHVLEIGTGWGSNAIFLAQTYGCRVTTSTISAKQADVARERVREFGLQDRVEVLEMDYRDLTGKYDRLVSIEMIEAIGHRQLPTFFAHCTKLVKPEGLAAIQVITMPDQGYRRYLRSIDFIRTTVFPGSCCPSRTALLNAAAKASDMRLVHLEEIGRHYARTLAEWRERLLDNWEQIKLLGYSEEFLRLWNFYLCYCEAGFAERHIGTAQMIFSRPDWRGEVAVARAHEAVLR
ncbi:MAG: class I SAM-dependent methyltransferase [Armatimonadetes bacterium]|nr:class I SAM-dependent methyltransferase [Armatimonadota bacterium]